MADPGPLVIAHRGASSAHPPGNTLVAFRAAAELGADGVELDVRRTADGELVVHHDLELPDGRALITLTADEVPDWVPSLRAALDTCAEVGLALVNVEIKNDPHEADFDERRDVVEAVLATLDGFEPASILISSFDPESVAQVRRLDSPFPTALLVWDPAILAASLDAAAAAGHVGVNPWSPYVDAALMEHARRLGLAVNVWTVDDPAETTTLAGLGVSSIITNVPDVTRAALGR